MNTVGIDFLGGRSWRSNILSDMQPHSECVEDSLPSAILPLKNQEALVVGKTSAEHRRGRGLHWPPEAQVPVLGNPANGSGRVPLAAIFERLGKAEASWGKLGDTRIAWRPEGVYKVEVEAAKLISAHVLETTPDCQYAGIVIPDSLGIAGKQAVISACIGIRPILVPKTVAVTIAWCRRQKWQDFALSTNEYIGHLTVIDLAFGSWCVATIPVCIERHGASTYLQPVHIPQLKRTKMATTGWSMLLAGLGASESQAMRRGWGADLFSGRVNMTNSAARKGVNSDGDIVGLCELTGNSEMENALQEVVRGVEETRQGDEFGKCLGLLLAGPLAVVQYRGQSLAGIIRGRLGGLPLIACEETYGADGAAFAADGLAHKSPTWLEMVEPLEIYCIGKSENGDPKSVWLKLLEKRRIQAGTEYHNEDPIKGLKLQAGHSSVEITLRRPDEKNIWEYRKVLTTQGRKSSGVIPLLANVVAMPGQGFAEVSIESKQPDLFSSRLDWHKMEVCSEPEEPKLSYIPSSLILLPAKRLWRACYYPLHLLKEALDADEDAFGVISASTSAIARLKRSIPGEKYVQGNGRQNEQTEFLLYTPMGRNAETLEAAGKVLLESIENGIATWIVRHAYEEDAHLWLKKVVAWWYLRCPRWVVVDALKAVLDFDTPTTVADLLVVGLSLDTSTEITDFFEAFCRKMLSAKAPNNWLKALRDIVKYNEHALRDIGPDLVDRVYRNTHQKLSEALDTNRPLIAQNSIEVLLYTLKRRRYENNFASPGSSNYMEVHILITQCKDSYTMTPKAKKFASVLDKFLSNEGDLQDATTMIYEKD